MLKLQAKGVAIWADEHHRTVHCVRSSEWSTFHLHLCISYQCIWGYNIYKNPPPNVISPIFFAIFISLWGSIQDSADCWSAHRSSAVRDSFKRVHDWCKAGWRRPGAPPPNKNPGYAGGWLCYSFLGLWLPLVLGFGLENMLFFYLEHNSQQRPRLSLSSLPSISLDEDARCRFGADTIAFLQWVVPWVESSMYPTDSRYPVFDVIQPNAIQQECCQRLVTHLPTLILMKEKRKSVLFCQQEANCYGEQYVCLITRSNKIAIQGTPQMTIDKEVISLLRVYLNYFKCRPNIPLF